jgi:hypothetical protein
VLFAHTLYFANAFPNSTDIEQEVNGVYSFGRKEKIPAAEVKKIFDAAQKSYYHSLSKGTE